MARPTKWRRVEFIPEIKYFAPARGRMGSLPENMLLVEELEAIRLKDLEGLDQEVCAKRMEVSRQTFQRVLNSAREKIADSLINGKAIRIEGGSYTRHICHVRCLSCGKEWRESYENYKKVLNGEYSCPECNSDNITCVEGGKRKFCRGKCWRHGRNG